MVCILCVSHVCEWGYGRGLDGTIRSWERKMYFLYLEFFFFFFFLDVGEVCLISGVCNLPPWRKPLCVIAGANPGFWSGGPSGVLTPSYLEGESVKNVAHVASRWSSLPRSRKRVLGVSYLEVKWSSLPGRYECKERCACFLKVRCLDVEVLAWVQLPQS